MNEQLAAIRARREAVTPGVWEVGSMYTTGDAVVGVTDNRIVCVLGAEEQCHADAAFVAAAPGDIDTLLAMVDAQQREIARLYEAGKDMQEQRDGWQEETQQARRERDALREQLQQAQAQLAAVPVNAIIETRNAAELHGYTNAELDEWLDAEQEAANAAAELRAPTYNGGCW